MYANVQKLRQFVMSSRTVPAAAALRRQSRCCPGSSLLALLLLLPVGGVGVAADCPLLLLLLPALPVAACCPLITQPKVSDRQMILLKVCMSVCARVFG